jgi:uncharacterized BrkB/YihY/UPF0761 family membrane protein
MTPRVSAIGKVSDYIITAILFGGGAFGYRSLSSIRVRWKNALAGSVLFPVLLTLMKWEFPFYVKKFSRLNPIYGSLFGIICFIIVSYLFAAAYLFVASIIGVLEREERETFSPVGGTGATWEETYRSD